MKKKFFIVMLVFAISITTCFTLFGCNKKYAPLDNPILVPDLTDNAIVKTQKAEGIIDNTNKSWKSKNFNKDGYAAAIEIDFGKSVIFNTAIIEEKGSKVRFFRLQKFEGEKWIDFYRSDKIEDYRMCVFTAVETQFLRFVVDESVGNFSIKELSIYNMPKKEMSEEFRVSAYVRFDGDNPREVLSKGDDYARVYAKYYEVITDVILFNVLGWDANGEIEYYGSSESADKTTRNAENKANFIADLAAFKTILSMREKQSPINITATFFNPTDKTADTLQNNMEKVVNNIYATVMEFDLDGIDIDWEYPSNSKEWGLYDSFINKINDKFDMYKVKDLTYSSALSTWGVNLKAATIDRIDQLNYMGYDNYDKDGWQSTFKVTAVDAMAYYKSLGFNPKQINLGVPYFARPTSRSEEWPSWRNYDFGEEGYWKNYYYNIEFNGNFGSVHFNSPGMVADKTAYSINVGLGGVMVFRLACDKLMDDPNCLTKAIGKTIGERIKY